MPNPNKKIDCEVVNKTYSVMCSCPPLEFAREIVGGKFTSLDYLDKTERVMSNLINEFDYDGSAGEYIVYPGYTQDNTTRKLLANTETQKKDFEVHSKEILDDLNELTGSEKLNEYPAIKGFAEYRSKFLKAALDGTDRWAVLAEIPGGYGLSLLRIGGYALSCGDPRRIRPECFSGLDTEEKWPHERCQAV